MGLISTISSSIKKFQPNRWTYFESAKFSADHRSAAKFVNFLSINRQLLPAKSARSELQCNQFQIYLGRNMNKQQNVAVGEGICSGLGSYFENLILWERFLD